MPVAFSIDGNVSLWVAFLIYINSVATRLSYFVPMQSVADRLADVQARIAEAELRIAEQQERIASGDRGEAVIAAFMLHSAASTLRELRAYKARLEHLIALKASAHDT